MNEPRCWQVTVHITKTITVTERAEWAADAMRQAERHVLEGKFLAQPLEAGEVSASYAITDERAGEQETP